MVDLLTTTHYLLWSLTRSLQWVSDANPKLQEQDYTSCEATFYYQQFYTVTYIFYMQIVSFLFIFMIEQECCF